MGSKRETAMATGSTANPEAPETRPWDAAEHIATDEDAAAYLEAALEEGDAALVAAALDDIARARGLPNAGRLALTTNGGPEFAAVLERVRALGLRLHATAAP